MLFLIENWSWYKKLQAELDERFTTQTATIAALGEVPLLEACINEGLRSVGPEFSGASRIAPASGALVADKYWIPGGTVVRCPAYV